MPRQPTPVSHRSGTLTRAELALYRGHVQGMSLRALHARYFPGEPREADLRHLKARIVEIERELAAASHRTGRAELAQLFTGAAAATDTARRAAGRNGTTAAGAARPVRRLLDALAWIEARGFPQPRPQDRVEEWLAPLYADKLRAAGLLTLAQLTERIEAGGRDWHHGVRGLGAAKAARIEAWLAAQAPRASVRLPEAARLSAGERRQARLASAPAAAGIVPLERLHCPAALDGRDGRFRAAPAAGPLLAANDVEAVHAWLAAQASPHTARAYRREAERLLLWCLQVRGQPLSSLDGEGLRAYLAFLQDPQPAARWCGPRGTPRWSPAWRPFEGPLSAAAIRHALAVLQALARWLVRHGYLAQDAWAGVVAPLPCAAPASRPRQLTLAQWQHLDTLLARLDDRGARPRLKFALRLLAATGLRLSEAVGCQAADLRCHPGPDGQPAWRLRVTGPRGQPRDVTVPASLAAEAGRYLQLRGLGSDCARVPAGTLLLGCATGDGKRLPAGRAGGGITAGTLYRQIKAFFALAATSLAATDAQAAAGLRLASTGWLRHLAPPPPGAAQPHGTQAVAEALADTE